MWGGRAVGSQKGVGTVAGEESCRIIEAGGAKSAGS